MKKNLALIIVFLCVAIAAFLTPFFQIDFQITNLIQKINFQPFTQAMWFVSNLGNQPTMVYIIGITTAVLYLKGYRKEAIISISSSTGGALSGLIIKMLVDRPRPSASIVNVQVWLSDKSFPSNHALVFTVFFGFFLYLLLRETKKKYKHILLSIALFTLIISIGISRIFLGAHWASDVFGGYLLGSIWLLLAIRLYNSSHGHR